MADIVGSKALTQVSGSTDIMYTDRRRFYLKENYLANLWENATPFLNFSSQIQTISNSPDPDYKLFEYRPYWVDNFVAYQDEAGTDTLTAGTSIASHNIDDGAGVGRTPASIVGTVFEIWNSAETTKKAICVITAVVSTSATDDVVTFTPIWVLVSGTTACAQNDIWYVIGNAQEEGSTSPAAYSQDMSVRWNSAQIFETPVQMSDVARKANLRPVNEWSRLMVEASKQHKIQGERAIVFGARRGTTSSAQDHTGAPNHVTGANSEYIRTTAGFIPIMDEDYDLTTADRIINITEADYTWADFVEHNKDIFYYQENDVPLFCFHGPDFGAFLDKAAANGFFGDGTRVNVGANEESEFGFKIRRLYTTEGELRLVRTPVLRGRYSGYACIVDPRYVGVVKYEPDMYKTNIQANDSKTRKDEYFSDFGFYLNLVEKHCLLKVS
jgi:hypothetical protein